MGPGFRGLNSFFCRSTSQISAPRVICACMRRGWQLRRCSLLRRRGRDAVWNWVHICIWHRRFGSSRVTRAFSRLFFGQAGTKVLKRASIQGRELLACELDLFDAERDTFPYPDGHFELVLACELLEHLRADPMHMFFEIHRVLDEGGWLLISTPNCASAGSLEQCLWRSANPYTYSLYPMPETKGDDPGSHTREYTPDEVRRVFECAGFEVAFLFTRAGRRVEGRDLIEDLLGAYGFPVELRGEQMYCLGRKTSGVDRVRFPGFLYG